MNCHQLSTLFLHGSSLSFPSRKPIEYPDMARKTLMLLLAPALADPDCLKPGLGKDPMLPAPSMYVANWATCAENCAKSLTCQEYSFKSDRIAGSSTRRMLTLRPIPRLSRHPRHARPRPRPWQQRRLA